MQELQSDAINRCEKICFIDYSIIIANVIQCVFKMRVAAFGENHTTQNSRPTLTDVAAVILQYHICDRSIQHEKITPYNCDLVSDRCIISRISGITIRFFG